MVRSAVQVTQGQACVGLYSYKKCSITADMNRQSDARCMRWFVVGWEGSVKIMQAYAEAVHIFLNKWSAAITPNVVAAATTGVNMIT